MIFFTRSQILRANSELNEPLVKTHDLEINRRNTIIRQELKRPIKVTMNNVLSKVAELSFTVRLYTGKRIDKEDMKYKVIKTMRDFEVMEEYLIKDKKLISNPLVQKISTQSDQNFLGRHDKQFAAIIQTLQEFINQIVASDVLLRDARVLEFLDIPVYKRARLSELLPSDPEFRLNIEVQDGEAEAQRMGSIVMRDVYFQSKSLKAKNKQEYAIKIHYDTDRHQYQIKVNSLVDLESQWVLIKRRQDFVVLSGLVGNQRYLPHDITGSKHDHIIDNHIILMEEYLRELINKGDPFVSEFLKEQAAVEEENKMSIVEAMQLNLSAQITGMRTDIIGEKPKVIFDICLLVDSQQALYVSRTYKHFKLLHIPGLPQKRSEDGFKKAIPQLQHELEVYLNEILNHYSTVFLPSVAEFFECTDLRVLKASPMPQYGNINNTTYSNRISFGGQSNDSDSRSPFA
ncbi:hypothetical protein FGO68_gene14844 [Halteria grandinella]|uniref:PX domain-containing protein n=1 Tax=Halteria grandinella TaxID=5974 RepID=A0A8J8NUW8_HALGN|nr:hypothetical protein FGO68_gene14844 [Halteria grandinella]